MYFGISIGVKACLSGLRVILSNSRLVLECLHVIRVEIDEFDAVIVIFECK